MVPWRADRLSDGTGCGIEGPPGIYSVCLMFVRVALAVFVWAMSTEAWTEPAGRLEIVDRLERQFEGEFMFVTSGDGRYGIYQRLDGPLASEREVTCLMRSSCYVDIVDVSEADLRRADADPARLGPLRDLLSEARNNQRRAAAAPPEQRAALEAEWFAGAARIETCLARGAC